MLKEVKQKKNVTPPDGGWGWMVVFGAAFINLVNQSIFASYGLIFGERLKSLANGRATALTMVMSLNMVVSNVSGLLVGPLLKNLSVRTVTFMGIFGAGSGMIICSFSSAIWHICIGYSLVAGIGLGLLISSTFLAINDYFTTKKSTAVGISMAGTSLGQMLMPAWIGILLNNYGFNFAAMILGLMSFSGMFGAMIFKPVFCCKTWADRGTEEEQTTKTIQEDDKLEILDEEEEEEVEELLDKKVPKEDEINNFEKVRERKISFSRQDSREDGRMFKKSREALNRRISREERGPAFKKSREFLNRSNSMDEERSIFDESREKAYRASIVEIASSQIFDLNERVKNQRWHTKLAHALGLPLLKDLVFVNILMGLGFGSISMITFSTFFPLFLQEEAGLTLMQTATCMSALGCADVIGRITGPEIDRRLNLTYRGAFIVGCVLMAISRSVMVMFTDFKYILVSFFFIGFFRSMAVINQNLSISDHIEKEKLPSAVGLNMVNKAIVSLTFGQSLGYLKDFVSYGNCIHILNLILFMVAGGYLIEMLIIRMLNNKNQEDVDTDEEESKV